MTIERPNLFRLCGLKEQPVSGMKWHELISAGLPYRGVRATARAIGVSEVDLANLLGISETAQANRETPLSRDVSNLLYRIALAFTRTALKLSYNLEATALWLRTAQPILKDYIPILLLQSQVGTDYVFTAIDRMEVPLNQVIYLEEAPDEGTAEFEHNFEGDDPDEDSDSFNDEHDD